jgi:endogenous inhibitor of DNA gyrase (YacG/DUF329 family)
MPASASDAKPARCPICGKPSVADYRPFCSKRCADVDLARWFTGSYAIGGREEDEGDAPVSSDGPKAPENDEDEP